MTAHQDPSNEISTSTDEISTELLERSLKLANHHIKGPGVAGSVMIEGDIVIKWTRLGGRTILDVLLPSIHGRQPGVGPYDRLCSYYHPPGEVVWSVMDAGRILEALIFLRKQMLLDDLARL